MMRLNAKLYGILLVLGLCYSSCFAQEIIEVLPLTDKIIMIHLDEGSVNYVTKTMTKTAMTLATADNKASYGITSPDDVNYTNSIAPTQVGRKSKATEYMNDAPWKGTHFDPTGERWASEHWIYLQLTNPLVTGKNYTISTGSLASNGSSWNIAYDEKNLRSEAVHVNTIGYSPSAPKYGYIYHWPGNLGSLDLSSYASNTFSVYEVNNLTTPVKTGTIVFRKSATNAETGQPGDTPNENFLGSEVYEADFTDVTASGNYILVVDGFGKSFPFKIGIDPVWEPYYRTMRALYHQRSGIHIEATYDDHDYIRPVTQNPMVTEGNGVSFAGKILYSKLPFMSWTAEDGGTANAQVKSAAEGNPLNVAGWYHDAGDWDAYHTHQRIPMMLMTTFEHVPTLFADDEMDIPESGNGIPDIVDEASWLVKFNYRLRKETKLKGYSDGGVGGARVAGDPYTTSSNSPESEGKPSWQDTRNYAVTEADAFMTYMYAGEAAQLALILKKVGRDPHKHMVEMLDAISFDDMTYDEVDFVKEAEEAFTWASAEANQPANGNNYADLYVYRTYAAVNLYRLTGLNKYHKIAKEGLSLMTNVANLDEDQRFSAYCYLLADNYDVDTQLQTALIAATEKTAKYNGVTAAEKRATRWGGNFNFPMLIGQATTPWMFDNIIAYAVTGDMQYKNVVHTTVDYFLGTNPLHTTWMTGVGPRPVVGNFNLDARHIGQNWSVYPGWIPYGPWRVDAGTTLYTETMPDGIVRQGGAGPWNTHWPLFSLTPTFDSWPGHEQLFDNMHTPLGSENTVHQQAVRAAVSYAFANGRSFTNTGSNSAITSMTIDQDEITFTLRFDHLVVLPTIDNMTANFSVLKWSSSDETIAHVDQFGRITAVANGTATITCSTLDASVSASVLVTCDNLQDIPVSSIEVNPTTVNLTIGSKKKISINVLPDNAADKSYTWSSDNVSIAYGEDEYIYGVTPGQTIVHVTSNTNAEAVEDITVNVMDASYTIFADFDQYIPVTGGNDPIKVEFFSPGGVSDIAFDNPATDAINGSAKVVKFERAANTYQLIGLSSPTLTPLPLCSHSKLHFSYLSNQINSFYIKINKVGGESSEQTVGVTPAEGWQKLSIDLPTAGFLETILIFANPTEEIAFTSYYDDFKFEQIPNAGECGNSFGILDFEEIVLDWNSGYGSFSWASDVNGIVDNEPSEANSSNKIFKYERDGTNAGGGFGVRFPEESLLNNTKASFKVTATSPFQSIRIEFMKLVDEVEVKSFIELNNLGVVANEWKTVTWDINAMEGEKLTSFIQITVLPALGTTNILTAYIDDFALQGIRPQSIIVEGEASYELEINEALELSAQVLPANADNTDLIWRTSDATIAAVSAVGQVTAIKSGEAVIKAVSAYDESIEKSVTIKVKQPILSIDEKDAQTTLYPNPTSSELVFKSEFKIQNLSIYDIAGQLVQAVDILNQNKYILNTSMYARGTYILKAFFTDGHIRSYRFVRK